MQPWHKWLAALLLIVASLVGGYTASRTSATFDEPAMILAGTAAWRAAPTPLNREHPPLAKLWLGLPAALSSAAIDHADPDWRRGTQWQIQFDLAHRFLYKWNRDNHHTIVWSARAMALLLTLLLCASVGLWAKRLAGPEAGLCALALCALSPTVLAHGTLATLDLPLAATVLFALYALDRQLHHPSWWRVGVTGLCLCLALTVKATAWLVCPLGLAQIIYFLISARRRGRSQHEMPDHTELWRTLAQAGAAFVLAVTLLNLAYLVSGTTGPATPPDGAMPLVIQLMNPFLPAAYVEGLIWQLVHAGGSSHYLSFLNGELSAEGFPDYFFWVFLMKSSIAELLALAAALALAARHRSGSGALFPLAAGTSWLLFIALASDIQLGMRYLLPALPLLFVFCGAVLSRHRVLAAGIGALQLIAVLSSAPNLIPFFNIAAGGTEAGAGLLSDSNLDWGQDLPRLAEWQAEHGQGRPLALAYFGSADPRAHGVEFETLPAPPFQSWYRATGTGTGSNTLPCGPPADGAPTLWAVSITNLHGIYLPDPTCYHWLVGHSPVTTIGGSIMIFELK